MGLEDARPEEEAQPLLQVAEVHDQDAGRKLLEIRFGPSGRSSQCGLKVNWVSQGR